MSKTFYIADTVIARCENSETASLIELAPKTYQQLGCAVPKADAPVVGFLLDRCYDGYTTDWYNLLPLAKAGAQIRLLTYKHCEAQLQDCSGLVISDGTFAFPDAFFADLRAKVTEHKSSQSAAYARCIYYALRHHMPILGISIGAQMVAGVFGLKMYRNYDFVETPIPHKTHKDEAHLLNVFPNTPLARIFGGDNQFHVNSRHGKLLAPVRTQLKIQAEAQNLTPNEIVLPLEIYAEANDGIPEAWGSQELHILCVQWQVETMAARGDERMQRIYQWLIDEIKQRRNQEAA